MAEPLLPEFEPAGLDEALEFPFPTSSQTILMLLIRKSHFKNQYSIQILPFQLVLSVAKEP